MNLIKWNIYQVNSSLSNLIGVKFRGTLRKFSIENNINLLTENASDEENVVRFALIADNNEKNILEKIENFVKSIINDSTIKIVLSETINPILSKLKNNDISRY